MKNIILFFGGKSPEHDISIITAMQAKANFDTSKYNLLPIYISKSNKFFLADNYSNPKDFINFAEKSCSEVFLKPGSRLLYKEGKFKVKALCRVDACVVACHGSCGEDGTLQGLLELCGIPYSTCGVAASAICMDKVYMKGLFEINNFPVTKYVWFKKQDYIKNPKKILSDICINLDFPVVVKPANLGSSIGISICKEQKQLEDAIAVAKCYDHKILVEEAVLHVRELNCACMESDGKLKLSVIHEPVTWQAFFDFDKKYIEKNTKAISPKSARIPTYIKAEIKKMTQSAYKLFDLKGVVRVDFLYNDDTEELFVSEINSIPGSLAHFMFADVSFVRILDDLVLSAEKNFEERSSLKLCYESSVLTKDIVLRK